MCSLLLYRNITVKLSFVCLFLVNFKTLLNSLVYILWDISVNYHIILSSFLVGMSFVYLSCFIVMARTSSTIFIRVVRVDIFALFLIIGGKHSVFHH